MLAHVARISGLSGFSFNADVQAVLLFSLLGLTLSLALLQSSGADVSALMQYAE